LCYKIDREEAWEVMNCKHCGSEEYTKDGIVDKKQRYKCKQCNRTFREGDKREKYTNEKRMRVIKWYLEGVGIMSIERMEGVPNPLIIKWIRKYAQIIREELKEAPIPEHIKDIDIIELDELFSYCKKKLTKSTYGLLLIDNDLKLLILKSPSPGG
jgi:transposase-like protein